MSDIGPKQTSVFALHMSAFGGKADIALKERKSINFELLEALQAFTPDRHADFYAALFGACGALTQALLAEVFIRVRAAYYRHRFLKRPGASSV